MRTKNKISIIYFFSKDIILTFYKKPPKVLTNEETIEKIIKGKCSVCRYGDGEFHLMVQNRDLKFQNRSEQLSKRLKEILLSEEENLLVCIPKVFTMKDLKRRTKQSKRFWKDHVANYRLLWYKHLNLDKNYYNSTFTRNYIAINDKSNLEAYFNEVKRIWENRDLLIIEGQYSRLGVGNDLFKNSKSIIRILAPHENAYNNYDLILAEAKKHSKDKLVLIALGPTATILAYDLHISGYQAIDIGHLDVEFEWFLKKTLVRTKIENKYVIEANNKIEKSDSFKDEKYYKEIVAKIV